MSVRHAMLALATDATEAWRFPASAGERVFASPSGLTRPDQTALVGEYDGLDPVAQVEFAENPADVGLDRGFGDD